MAQYNSTAGYDVQEFSELDFEHITLETPAEQQCTSCGTSLAHMPAGIHSCTHCGTIQHIDIEV